METNDTLIRRTRLQEAHEWDLFLDIPWDKSVDTSLDLLPVDSSMIETLNCSKEETKAASWVLGLIAASAIAEHEKVLINLKPLCWDSLSQSPAMRELGEQFFKEEAKHSKAYSRYLDTAAKELNLLPEELRSVLPTFNSNSIIAQLHKLDFLLGGKSIWWCVAVTEEESIKFFRMIAKKEKDIDPLFFTINKLHYEEEIRHSSFSYMMLDQNKSFISNFSYSLYRSLQMIWLYKELKRLKKVKNFKDRHPILNNFSSLVERYETLPIMKKLQLFFNDISYTKMMLNPHKHVRIAHQIKKTKRFYLLHLLGRTS